MDARAPSVHVRRAARMILPVLLLGSARAEVATAPAAADGLVLRGGDTVLFLGDELIDAADPRSSTNFPFLVETFLTARYPALHARFVHAGWEHDTVARALLRLDRDALPHRPGVVVVCLGLNDPEYVPFSEERLAAYKRDLARLVERLAISRARVWLISPPSVNEDAARNTRVYRDGQYSVVNLRAIGYNATLARYAEAMRQQAEASGCGYVDWYAESIQMRLAHGARAGTGPDGRLPSMRGHLAVATRLLAAWGAQPVRVQLDVNWQGNTATLAVEDRPPTELRMEMTETGRRILELRDLPLPWPLPGQRAGQPWTDRETARMCEFTMRAAGAPARGVTLQLECGGLPAGSVSLTGVQLGTGLDLAATDLFRSLPLVQELLRQIGAKNFYQYSTWRRQELNPPREPELADAHRQLVAALRAYARGYEQVIRRTPKRFDARLVLFEAVPPERLATLPPSASRPHPVATSGASSRPAGRPATRPE